MNNFGHVSCQTHWKMLCWNVLNQLPPRNVWSPLGGRSRFHPRLEMVSTVCLKFPPIWSKGRFGWGMWQRLCGLEGSNSSYPPAARRAERNSSWCSGNKWSNPRRYGVSSGTAPPWTHCVALGKSLYFSEPISTFKNKKVRPLKNLSRGGHPIQEMLQEGELLLVFPQLFPLQLCSPGELLGSLSLLLWVSTSQTLGVPFGTDQRNYREIWQT